MSDKILIVEDEAAIADTLQYALETESFSPRWVTTGREALQLLEAGDTALVVLDVGLPDINGFELLKKIRERSDVPVIFLTARNDEIDRVVGLEIGADDYVTKPFSPRELVARVKVVLRRLGPVNGAPAEAPPVFRVDPAQATVFFHGRPLELTRAEYALLCGLLAQPRRVFSRGQLMEKVWSPNHPSDERTIDTHIKALRAKLRDIVPDSDPIRTHRGLGYSIEP